MHSQTPALNSPSTASTTLTVDNDFFDFSSPPRQRPDNNYSHGIALRRDNVAVKGAVLRRLCLGGVSCTAGFGLAQRMYTPESDGGPPPADLRPYAGVLVARIEVRSFRRQLRRAVALSLGTTGAPSGAQKVQEIFHAAFGFREVAGWPYQVPAEPLVGLDLAIARAWRAGGTGWGVRATPEASASLGNLRTGARVGVDFESGWSLDDAFGLAPGSNIYSSVMFGGVAADFRVHAVELDGALTRRSPSVQAEFGVLRWHGGLRIRYSRITIEYSLHAVTQEVQQGRRQHVWGRIGATVWR